LPSSLNIPARPAPPPPLSSTPQSPVTPALAAPPLPDRYERVRSRIVQNLGENPGLVSVWVAGVEIIGTYEAQFLNWLGIPISLE